MRTAIIFVFILFALSLVQFQVLADTTSIVPGATNGDQPCNCQLEANRGDSSPCRQYCTGNYTLNDFLLIAINVSVILLGITGSLALVAFIYGGVLFLISAGNKEMVTKGKQAMVGAVIGVAIVLLAYTIIGFIFTNVFNLTKAEWFKTDWFKN